MFLNTQLQRLLYYDNRHKLCPKIGQTKFILSLNMKIIFNENITLHIRIINIQNKKRLRVIK